jgi:hypothetical protein
MNNRGAAVGKRLATGTGGLCGEESEIPGRVCPRRRRSSTEFGLCAFAMQSVSFRNL